MKKLLGILLACAMVVPAFAGDIFSNVETYGEIQTIGSLTRAKDADINSRTVSNRVIFGLGMDLVEDVRANVTFLNSNYWGTDANQNGATVNDYFDRIRVAEANVTLSNIFGALELKVGRQFYGDENSTVMYYGPTHYKNVPSTITPALPPVIPTSNIQDSQSLDAAVLSYTSDKFAANIIYGKITETASDYDDDESLLGLDAKYNVSDALALQAYLFDYAYPALNNHLGIWGVKPTYKDDALNLAVEFAKNYTGNKAFASSNKGWMVKADAGIDVAFESMDITPRVSYIHSEKDFQANGNYMPGLLISYGLGQLFRGSGDVRIINGGLDIKFASLEKWNFALDYFGASNDYGTGMEWFGNEFDLMAKYALNEYVELHGALGILTNADETHPYTGQLGMIVRF